MSWRFSFMFSYSPDQHLRSFLWLRTLCSAMLQRSIADPAQVRGMCCRAGSEICAVCISRYSNRSQNSRTPQRSCRAAHGAKHLPFCAAAIRRRRLSQWGIETRHWTSRILTYPALIEAGVFPTEINRKLKYRRCGCPFMNIYALFLLNATAPFLSVWENPRFTQTAGY